ncbi:MAG: hypothetical protein ABJB86_11525 [Bacteroidota bacterium]
MRQLLLICAAFIVLLSSCASLTKSQIETVNHFARISKNFSAYPSKILTGLADLSLSEGVYFSNSLDSVKLHIDDLNGLYESKKDVYKSSAKADITFKIIDKYAQALLLISSDKHAADLDSQTVNFGTGLDNLITTYNTMPDVKPVQSGLGGVVGSIVLAGGKQLIRTKQAKAIQEFVPKADTLISVMTSNLLEFLTSTNIDLLIKNEERNIQRNYKSFLSQRKATIQNERDYLGFKADIDNIKILRDQTIEATKNLRKAHLKLVNEIKEKKDLKEVIAELQTLYEDISNVKSTISALNTVKN